MKKSNLFVLWPSFLILLLDQITKAWVRSNMPLEQSIPLLGEHFFRLTHVENTGVAFGIQAGNTTFLTIFSTIAAAVLVFLLVRSPAKFPRLVQVALALILGGALGNLLDRLFFGHVTDFLDFDFPDFIMQRWPVFNVADSAVTIGVTLWCVYLVFYAKPRASADKLSSAPQTPESASGRSDARSLGSD